MTIQQILDSLLNLIKTQLTKSVFVAYEAADADDDEDLPSLTDKKRKTIKKKPSKYVYRVYLNFTDVY